MAALSYVRTHSRDLGLDDDYFQTHDIHIHVPAGAIPKDGPSAGVTMATAICSLVTGTPINSDVAMTGEVTLTGQVLPIGGLKEKTLAAQRAGITTVILPSRNEPDLEDVPEELRKDMTFVPVDRVEQVWETAMGLKMDGKGAELAAANELLEEASELLQEARRKAGIRAADAAKAAAAGKRGRAGRRARRPTARAGAQEPAGRKPVRKAPARPKAAPAKTGGDAKKTTAARGRSGRAARSSDRGRGRARAGRRRCGRRPARVLSCPASCAPRAGGPGSSPAVPRPIR